MLLAFSREETDESRVNLDAKPIWRIKYCVASPTFAVRFFPQLQGRLDPSVAVVLTQQNRDIADSITTELAIKSPSGEEWRFRAEFFFNQYNVFGLLAPVGK